MASFSSGKILIFGLLFSSVLQLAGCGKPSQHAGTHRGSKDTQLAQKTPTKKRYKLENDVGPRPHERIPDVHRIPDAKPKPEPKSKIGNPRTYTVFKKSYNVLPSSKGFVEHGTASWYGKKFHGYKTSNGEVYDMYSMSAAHKTLPLPTYAKVTNLDNGRSIIVKINDRGPFHEDRIIDLSYAAASKLGILARGVGRVRVEAIDPTIKIPQKFFLQVGSFKHEDKAQRIVDKLKSLVKSHPITIKSRLGKNKLYQVHIGPIKDETVIRSLKNRLANQNLPDLSVIQLQ